MSTLAELTPQLVAGRELTTAEVEAAAMALAGTDIIGQAKTGTGKTQITAGTGVTIQSKNGTFISARYGVVTLERLANDLWVAYGDTSAT